MRFTSLVVELIRARPRLVVLLVVLAQAAMWLVLPTLLYRSPPGDVATVLAFGREYQVGTYFGPPLAFWLADIAYRAVGNHLFGVYLLAQICAVVTFYAFYQLARAIVGGQQAVIAVLLSMTVVVFSSPGVEFGPLVLARPLWALLLLHSWQLIGQNRRAAWFAWSIEAGLLLLTTSAALGLLLLIVGFFIATARGRRLLMSLDPLYALVVIVVLVLPYLIWVIRADVLAMPPLPGLDDLSARATHLGGLLGGLLLAMAGIVVLVILNSRWFARNAEEAPIIYRPPVDPLAREFVYTFALGPALFGSLIAGVFNFDRVSGGAGVALLMSGLAVIVATGDLVYLRRQRLLRTVWAAALAAPAFVAIAATLFLPGNRTPTPQETQICLPFIQRQIELVNPDVLVTLGNPSTQTLLSTREGIMKTRGKWFDYDTGTRIIRAIATFHPAYLLRSPSYKRMSWQDLRAIAKELEKAGSPSS